MYAIKTAQEWDVPSSGVSYVTRFQARDSFLARFRTCQVSGQDVIGYWIPAKDLDELTDAIEGQIELVAEYRTVDSSAAARDYPYGEPAKHRPSRSARCLR